jgi:hypothetical protein
MEQIDSLKKEIIKIPEMLIDLNILEKEYINERIKTNYLQEELKCPTNVHIWRKLESTDKKSYDLIIKLQTLQKRILAKNDQIKSKEQFI